MFTLENCGGMMYVAFCVVGDLKIGSNLLRARCLYLDLLVLEDNNIYLAGPSRKTQL